MGSQKASTSALNKYLLEGTAAITAAQWLMSVSDRLQALQLEVNIYDLPNRQQIESSDDFEPSRIDLIDR